MSIQIKLKNSVVQDSTPSTSDLPAVGELALNANINSIGGFMRASNNTIVKIFGPGSVTTPTATTTVSGIAELATSSETTTGTATNRVVTPAGLNAVTVAERTTSNTNYLAKAGGTLTGVLTATAGSNSAPAINFGDSDSGIFGGTNTVSLAAGGATKLTVAGEVTVLSSLLIDSDSEQLRLGDDQDLKLYHNGSNGFLQNTTGAQMYRSATHMFENGSGATEYARIDSSGRLLVGHSSNFSISGSNPRFQLIGASDSTAHGYVGIFSANNIGANFSLVKSRNGTIGSQGLVQENDFVGNINFVASDGSDAAHSAARISAVIDGTAAANDLPGRLEFMTTADGSSSPTPKVVIKANGNIGCGTSSPGAFVHLSTDTPVVRLTDTSTNRFAQIVSEDGNLRFDADNDGDQSGSNITFRVDGGERLRIDSNGFLGINQGSPSTRLDLRMDNGTAYDGNVQTASFHGARIQNASGHTGGGAFTGVQFNITGDSQNRICSVGMITESSSNKKSSLVFGTDDDGNRTEKLRITGDGLVGIGNTSPQGQLHIGASTSPNHEAMIILNNGGATGQEAGIEWRYENITTPRAKIHVNSSDQILRFSTANSERMRLTGDGPHLLLGGTADVNEITESSANAGMVIGGTGFGNAGLAIITSTSGTGRLYFGDETANNAGRNRGQINYGHSDDHMRFVTASVERLRIDSDGDVGIGTSSPSAKLQVHGNILLSDTNAQIQFNSGGPIIQVPSANTLRFLNSSTNEVARFDSSERLLLGTSASLGVLGLAARIQLAGSTAGGSSISLRRFGNTAQGAFLTFSKSRSGADGSRTIVQDGDELGRIPFCMDDGVDLVHAGAEIRANVDGTPGANDTPGRLVFLTTPDGSSTPHERMRIQSNGFIGIGTGSPSCQLQINAGSGGDGTVTALELNHGGNSTNDAVKFNFARAGGDIGSIVLEKVASNNTTDFIFNTRASNTVSEAMRIKGDGNLSIGTTNGSAKLMVARDIADSASNNFSNQTVILTGTIGGNSTNNRTGLYFAPYNSSNQYCPSAISCVAGTNYQSNLKFFTNGAGNGTGHVESYERMRIDGSGNVGIGSAPLSRLSIAQSVSSGHLMVIRNTQTRANNVRYGIDFRDSSNETNVTIVAKQTGSNNQASMEIYANNGSGGNGITGGTSGIKAVTIGPGGLTTHKEFGMHDAAATESAKFLDFGFQGHSCNFRRTNGGDANHSTFMAVNSSNVITGDFNDTSDEKLKKNILSVVDGAIENIKKLRPVTFDWIDETRNNDVSGFVAQELKTVLPNLVNGTEYDPTFIDETKGSKGGIKSEGYSINTIGLVAHLTKALQEAIGKIETLETKVAGLEGA